MKQKRCLFIFVTFNLLSILIFIITGCQLLPLNGGVGAGGSLYLTDTFNGRIYTYDFITHKASTTPVLSTGQAASDRIYFYNNIGYIAVGATFSGNTPGVYWFDPNIIVPVAERIGNSISAQFIAFYSNTKAYVTDANWGVSTGVYTFNTSNPSEGLSGPIPGTNDIGGGMYLQDITIANNKVYVADNGKGQVLVINPSNDALVKTVTTTSSGTTGLLTSTDTTGTTVVYVANNSYSGAGSIDLINTNNDTLIKIVSNIDASRLILHSGTNKIYTIGFFGNTYVFTLTGIPLYSATEVKDKSGSSITGNEIIINNNLVYISNYDFGTKLSKLYVIDIETDTEVSYSPVNVGKDGEDGITGLAVYLK